MADLANSLTAVGIPPEAAKVLASAIAAAAASGGPAPGNATTATAGLVKQSTNIAALAAAPTEADFNGLLAAMRTAGLMASS